VPGGTTPSAAGQAALTGLFADGAATARTRSYAAFGEATWHATSTVDLTGGLRYTREKKDGSFEQVQRGPALTAAQIALGAQAIRNSFAPNIPAFFPETTENNLSGRATLSWKPATGILAYATYARGFKSGGLNLNATVAPKVIDPERVRSLEAGLKTEFLDRRATLNLAVFDQRVRNYQSQQVDVTVAPTAYIANVGTVRSRGVELDGSLRPVRGLSLFASGAYTDATYRNFTNAPCPVEYFGLATICNLSGRRLPGVSKWSFSAGGEYAQAIANDREAYLSADWQHRSDFYTSYNLAADSLAPAFDVVNARLGLRNSRAGWDLSVYARNLFNDKYFSITTASAFNTGQTSAILGDPRTYGVMLRWTI